MDDRQKETLRKQLSREEVQHRYQQAVNYFTGGVTDRMEYKIFQEQLIKRDLSAAAHAWFSMILTWEEYYNLVQSLIGFDLLVQGIIDGQIKAKGNGEDKDKEINPNDDLLGLEKEEENE